MKDKKDKGNRHLLYYWIIGIILYIIIRFAISPIVTQGESEEVSYSQFVSMIDNGQVREVTKDYSFKLFKWD